MVTEKDKQVEQLKRYYEFDEKRKTFDVVLHYKKASELFDENVVSFKTPKMSIEFVNKLADIVKDIPGGYKADISLAIDDYEDFNKNDVLQAFNDLLERIRYQFDKENKRKWFQIALLIIIGASVIFVSTLASIYSWWGLFKNQILQTVISEVLNISAWVFIWESVSQIFLKKSDILQKGSLLYSRVSSLSLYKGNSNKVLVKETNEQIVSHLFDENKLRHAGNILLLFSGFATIALALVDISTALISFFNSDAQFRVFSLVASLIFAFIHVIAGFNAIQLFLGKHNYRIRVLIVSIVNTLTIILNFVGLFLSGFTVFGLISVIISTLVLNAYVLGYVFYTISHRK